MEVKKFNKQTDYEEICEWWKSWKLPVHPKEILSENGITISKEGVNICTSFIYSTDSYICFFEFAIMNRNTTREQREGALERLGEELLLKAKSMGYNDIFFYVKRDIKRIHPDERHAIKLNNLNKIIKDLK